MTTEERASFQDRLDEARELEDFQALYQELVQLPASDGDREDLGEQLAMVALVYGFSDLEEETEPEPA